MGAIGEPTVNVVTTFRPDLTQPATPADGGSNRTPRRRVNGSGHGRHPVEGIDMTDPTDGWVTFQTVRLPDGMVLLVQKNDGSTRTIIASQRAHA